MATKTVGKTNGCNFTWEIENVSHHWWLPVGDVVESPTFIADELEGTKWRFGFCPQGDNYGKDISVYLHRDKYCSGPGIVEVKVYIGILSNENSLLLVFSDLGRFRKGEYLEVTLAKQKFFFSEREAFLPEDTLTIQCTLQAAKETLVKLKYLHARTVWNVNRTSLDWRIDKFSSLLPRIKNYKDDFIEFDLVLNKEFKKKLDIKMISFNDSIKYISCATSIIDSQGQMNNCGIEKYFREDIVKGTLTTPHFHKMAMENKILFLPNDILFLNFKFAFLVTEHFYCGKNTKVETKVTGQEKFQGTVILIQQLKSMCSNKIFCDTELRTSTKTFPAHKAILSARSPVFRNMFSHDMREANCGHIYITDFEDDTIHRLLLFIYTAVIDDLQVESASKLYAAADKYVIISLKRICSSFLKKNLCPENACDMLLLADLHNDEDLKNTVEDYMLRERKKIFCSQEWKDFMKNYIKLAADVMYKKMCQE